MVERMLKAIYDVSWVVQSKTIGPGWEGSGCMGFILK